MSVAEDALIRILMEDSGLNPRHDLGNIQSSGGSSSSSSSSDATNQQKKLLEKIASSSEETRKELNRLNIRNNYNIEDRQAIRSLLKPIALFTPLIATKLTQFLSIDPFKSKALEVGSTAIKGGETLADLVKDTLFSPRTLEAAKDITVGIIGGLGADGVLALAGGTALAMLVDHFFPDEGKKLSPEMQLWTKMKDELVKHTELLGDTTKEQNKGGGLPKVIELLQLINNNLFSGEGHQLPLKLDRPDGEIGVPQPGVPQPTPPTAQLAPGQQDVGIGPAAIPLGSRSSEPVYPQAVPVTEEDELLSNLINETVPNLTKVLGPAEEESQTAPGPDTKTIIPPLIPDDLQLLSNTELDNRTELHQGNEQENTQIPTHPDWEGWQPPHHGRGWNAPAGPNNPGGYTGQNMIEMEEVGINIAGQTISDVEYAVMLGRRIARGLPPPGFAYGGKANDNIPAMLSEGEVVVPKNMVEAGEVDHLRGKLPGFAEGGLATKTVNFGFGLGKSYFNYLKGRASADTDPANAVSGLGGGISAFGDIVGKAVPVVGAAIKGVGELTQSFASLMQEIDGTVERYSEFSPEIAQAQGFAEIRQSMGDLARAQEVGNELAKYVEIRADVQQKVEDVKVKVLTAMLPAVQKILQVIETIMPSSEQIAPTIKLLVAPLEAQAQMLAAIFGTVQDSQREPVIDPTELIQRSAEFENAWVPRG